MASERVIVLVDDMEPMLAIASDLLGRRLDNVRIVTFQRAEDALAWIQANPAVDMILSDNHMAGMDGLTFLERSRAVAPGALRVLMTAYLDIVATPPQLGARGVHALIRKPWEWSDMVRWMFEILASTPDDRARAEREGPLAYPDGAFVEFAASRKGAPKPTPKMAPTSPPAERRTVPVEAPARAALDGASVASRAPAAAPAPPTPRAPAAAPAPLDPTASPPRVIAAPGHNRLACPHCAGVIDIEVALPRATGNPEADEAARLLAYLRAHPGVAAHMRAQAAGAPPAAAPTGPKPGPARAK